MSYEGREAFICKNGHVQIVNTVYGGGGIVEHLGSDKCPHCEAEMVAVGSIDDTNCDALANFYFEKIADQTPINVCSCCGRPEKVIPEAYRVVRSDTAGHFMMTKLVPLEGYAEVE